MPHALIVHAHPEPNSFCTAQMHEALRALQAQGYSVEVSDLYAMRWHAELGRADFAHQPDPYFKPQAEQLKAVQGSTFAPDVAAELEKLRRADLLVFSFPLWWFSVPALLKGWVDRVFAMGAAYGGGVGTFATGPFRGKRALLLFTTGGPPQAYGAAGRNGELETLVFHIQHGMFYFVGFTVLAPVVSYAPARQSDEQRAAMLEEIRKAFSALDSRRIVFDF